MKPSPGLKVILPALGYGRVIEAETAPEAVALMRAEPVDLVFAPWETPGLSGAALMKALRNPGGNRAVPVVLLDDGLAPASVVAAVKAGIAGKVSLPGNIHEVRQVLKELETGRQVKGGLKKNGLLKNNLNPAAAKHPDGGDA
ncbi:MAG: response regulator [bacterium]